ncbi:beta-phosphoglucomutase family hydrolase [Parasalinivibrio latis]|uniref:beta-phosphoglucomutase family hydrolase n=1 Tax=Parasalinivibrio latis TaxID=2952610 RepID=UPI0030DFD3DB
MSALYDSYDALIFDLDGTVLDSMEGHLAAWRKVAQSHGFHIEDDWYHSLGGSPTIRTATLLVEKFSLGVSPQQLADEKAAYFMEVMEDHINELPFADVVRRYTGLKRMAVGTGTLTEIANRMLDKAGLLNCFNVVVGADQVDNHKPAPDTFLACARALNVRPVDCLVFEDADFGIQAAEAAGMDVVDVRKARVEPV